MLLALNITAALGTSIMAFILGMFIGVSLGYVLWAEKGRQISIADRVKNDARLDTLEKNSDRLDALEKDSDSKKRKRGNDDK